ncbi:DUF5706 domain-containing protein [Actinomadura fulvescens]|uniref:DUF5706 domain-containing protein n=1 Tax=Actinomadura fulvescens TaxID=46160 RepID=A0ABN3PCJ2_9ACTN
MSTSRTQVPGRALLEGELLAVRGELARIDTKVATLTSLAGAILAFLVTQAGADNPWPVKVLLVSAGLALAAAAVLLLTQVLRPRLGTTGFCRWAFMTGDEVRRALLTCSEYGEQAHQTTELIVLSRLARTKYQAVQRAVDLLTTGLVLTFAALVAGVLA